MTTLSDIRSRLRKDLHDEDSGNYRWTDAVLDRHIQKAVYEFSLAIPRQEKATKQTTSGSRDIDISSLTDRVEIERVEYPIGKYPPHYVRYSLWGNTLTLLVDSVPGSVQDVYIYYGKMHTLEASGSTIPQSLEDLLCLGASAYAAIEWASYAQNRVNVGGEDTWRAYLTWGQDRLARFHKELNRHRHKNRVRISSLYIPARLPDSQTTDGGP